MVNEQELVRKAKTGGSKVSVHSKVNEKSVVKGVGHLDGVLSKTIAKTRSKSSAKTPEDILRNVR